jgi:hypothetical protein
MTDNSNGRKWARFALSLALLASVGGNVLHTVLADSQISLWLRVPAAVLWPVFTFLGIEVLVRIIWERSFTHRLARNMVLFPAVPAAIVSYEHLYSLLGLMGERWFIQFIGPLAIDGTMIGMTMVLLFTRQLPPAPVAPEDSNVDAELERLSTLLEQQEHETEQIVSWTEPEPITPEAVAAATLRKPVRIITARASKPEQEKAVRLLLDGQGAAEVTASTGVSPATVRTYAGVMRTLRDNPNAEIGQKFQGRSVSQPLVDIIRAQMRELAVR